jgi:DNA invertase Pin-like site-specific DNA recombinase
LNKSILNVAAYCRVSTDSADQLNSLTSQIKYFTDYIGSNTQWRLKEVYYDEGITGTSVKKREAFNRMISDSEQGKIDLILTKEVSRFARNTVDTLSFTRRLSAINVGVIFTNDNIDTRDKDGELRLTIMASIAQEESRKTSERVKWGIKRKMEEGYVFGKKEMFGFKINNGVLEIVPEEAEIIKRIFNMYLYEKKGLHTIAKIFNSENIPTLKGQLWRAANISRIITNEKFVGDLTQAKRITTDYLTGNVIPNKGELIHIPNHHEGIISREVWDGVQAQLEERGRLQREGKKYSVRNWYSNKVFCGKCGSTYNAGHNGSNKTNGKRSVRCTNRLRNGVEIKTNNNGIQIGCDSRGINESALAVFIKYILEHIQNSREEIVKDMLQDIQLMQEFDKPIDTKPLEIEIDDYMRKKLKAYDLMLDDRLSKEDLIRQTAYYDNEIARLTEEINQNHNLADVHQMQIDKVKAHIAEVNKAAEVNTENTDIYGELLNKFVINEGYTIIYLNCMPIGFKLFYHTIKNPRVGKFDVIVDSYEVVD